MKNMVFKIKNILSPNKKYLFMRKLNLLLFAFTLLSFAGFSQNSQNKVASLENLTSFVPSSLTPEGDTLYTIRFAVNLIDTVNLNKIHVKIGSTFKGNDIFDGNHYVYTQTQSDTIFSRDGLRLQGNAGDHLLGIYFYEITVEDFQGVKYTPYIRQQ